jgi:hypothetical protein
MSSHDTVTIANTALTIRYDGTYCKCWTATMAIASYNLFGYCWLSYDGVKCRHGRGDLCLGTSHRHDTMSMVLLARGGIPINIWLRQLFEVPKSSSKSINDQLLSQSPCWSLTPVVFPVQVESCCWLCAHSLPAINVGQQIEVKLSRTELWGIWNHDSFHGFFLQGQVSKNSFHCLEHSISSIPTYKQVHTNHKHRNCSESSCPSFSANSMQGTCFVLLPAWPNGASLNFRCAVR